MDDKCFFDLNCWYLFTDGFTVRQIDEDGMGKILAKRKVTEKYGFKPIEGIAVDPEKWCICIYIDASKENIPLEDTLIGNVSISSIFNASKEDIFKDITLGDLDEFIKLTNNRFTITNTDDYTVDYSSENKSRKVKAITVDTEQVCPKIIVM